MRRVQVLGTGCPRCEALVVNAQQAIVESKIEGVVEKVTDLQEIIKFGVMATPALVVDGEVKSVGRVLSSEEIRSLL